MLYIDYYGLKEKPFHGSSHPNHFWIGEGQSEAISILKFGIDNGNGITALTGEVGTGKTVLAKYTAGLLRSRFKIAIIEDSNIESQDLLFFLADSLSLSNSFEDKRSIFKFIDEEYSNTRKRMVIILDEAHRSTDSLLNDLELMRNIKRDNQHLINIVLVGQNSLFNLLKNHPVNESKLNPSIHCSLKSLTESETNDYIKFHLEIAGTQRELFSSKAISRIFQYSGGIPRVINTICDHALMMGYSEDLKEIPSSVIKESADDLQIEICGIYERWGSGEMVQT